jgi:putative membrane protein
MAPPGTEIIQVFRTAYRLLRWLLCGSVALVVIVFVAQVNSLYLLFAGIHPLAGMAFLVAVAAAVWWLIGVPLAAFLRMPVAVRPPPLPPIDQGLDTEHLRVHLDHVARYLANQRANPAMVEGRGEIETVIEDCHGLRRVVVERGQEGLAESLREIGAFEVERVEPLLRPLDVEAERIIRQEALGVGVATAVTLNGTMDALIVLWRNVNLISKLARVYYGRPGARGSMLVLRDVSLAVLMANYMDNVANMAGGLMGKWMGHVAGLVAGPLINGGANAVMTLRVGYLAKARCRSFQAWTEEQRRSMVIKCFKLASDASRSVLTELATRVGGAFGGVASVVGGAVGVGGSVLRGAKDLFTGQWWKPTTGGAEEPPPA